MFARWTLAGLIATAVAGAGGLFAWLLSPVQPAVAAAVFAATALPFGMLLGWAVAVAPRTRPAATRFADSAESSWMDKALAGAATDIVTVVGLVLVVVSIARVELPTQLALLGVILVAFASTSVRYTVARSQSLKP